MAEANSAGELRASDAGESKVMGVGVTCTVQSVLLPVTCSPVLQSAAGGHLRRHVFCTRYDAASQERVKL
jgi:hypothetical protein